MALQPEPTTSIREPAQVDPVEFQFMRGQQRVLERIASRHPLYDVLDELARLIESQAPDTRASILVLEDGRRLRHGAGPSLPEEYTRAIDGLEIGAGAGSCGTAAFLGESVVVEDIATHPYWRDFRELAVPFGLRSCWSTPIHGADGQVLGTFALYTDAPHRPTPTERRLVEAAVHLAQVAIEHSRTDRALRWSEARSISVLQTSLDCIIIMGADGRISEWNPACEATFGYTRQEAVGSELADLIIPPRLRDAHREGLRRYHETGKGPVLGQRLELSAVDRTGREFPVELAIVANHLDEELFFTGHIRDISERKRVESALRDSEAYHRFLAASIPVQVWTAAPDGSLSYVAPQVAQYFGCSAEQIVGEGWQNFVYPADLPRAVERWTHSLQTGEPYEVQFRLRSADGEFRWHIARALPLRDDSGTITRWVGTNTDIEEQRRAEEVERRYAVEQLARQEAERREDQLRHYTAELERSNQELQSFAYVASHDLQEPLRKIQAFGDVLVEDYGEALGTEGREFLQRMQNAAGRMQTLINDLLAFSRVTSRAQPFQRVDLNRVARDAMETLELRVKESDANVEVSRLPEIEADATQMQQLFQNLIANALKFRRPGESPRIQVAAREVDGWYELRVADNGIGFEERYLDRIFGLFQRLHGRSGYEGTGVGLAICRKIVERHGGSITARSTPGEGSTFIVRLPITQPSRDAKS